MSIKRISVFVLALVSLKVAEASEPYRVNMSHLLSLIQNVDLNGKRVSVVDIYADYPTYKPVVANGEGFACVDDAARAAVLFIRYNEVFNKHENKTVINGLVQFILAMQTANGCFYNFVKNEDGKVVINTDGRTSVANFGWWAGRALWALGEAAVYYKHTDRPRFENVINAVKRSMPQVDSLLRNYGKLSASGNPTWLLYGDGADASSELVLGLNAAYEATGRKEYMHAAGKLCEGMAALQRGDCGEAPYGMFASNGEGWHGWANSQAAAILKYSRLSGDSTLFRKAINDINCFLPRWAGARFFRSCDSKGDSLDYSGQIAYDVRPAVSAAVEACEITHDIKYKTLACVLSSWFFGNNTAGARFYFEKTGLCFDGSIDSVSINRNSGAESTIEALLTMVELHRVRAAFHRITLTSVPSLNAAEYHYDFDGRVLSLKMTPNGFEPKLARSSR